MHRDLEPTPLRASRFYAEPPRHSGPLHDDWVARGSHFVLVYSRVRAGARLVRAGQVDEYMVLLPDAAARIIAGTDSVEAGGGSLTIVPPGDSEVLAQADGQVVRLFSARSADLLALAGESQQAGVSRVAPFQAWPDPVEGFRLRHYRLDDHAKAGDKTRIFRSTNLMVNVLLPRSAARDVHQLSPHAHADFEQGSLALQGHWVHHLRTPWTADMAQWRGDHHLEIDSPSLVVIPPTVVHTSRNEEGNAWLVDVFAPPRMDFSLKGMVRNADDYPMPSGTP